MNKPEKIRALLDRAAEDLEAVSLLLREGHTGAAAFAMRNHGDYGIVAVDRDDVEALLPAATTFVDTVRTMLGPEG